VSDLDTLTTQTLLFGSRTPSGDLPSGERAFVFDLFRMIQQLLTQATCPIYPLTKSEDISDMSDKSLYVYIMIYPAINLHDT